MTTPTIEQVVKWALLAGFATEPGTDQIFLIDGGKEIQCTIGLEAFATLSRADLEATVAEQAKEIDRLKVESRDACFGLNEYYGLKLAASQAYAAQLRESLSWIASSLPQIGVERVWMLDHANKSLAIPPDETALREHDAKLVERVSAYLLLNNATFEEIADKIRKGEF